MSGTRDDKPRRQLGLFGSKDEPAGDSTTPRGARSRGPVGPAPVPDDQRALGQKLPASIHLGTSSWSFPGWQGIVYDREASQRILARDGLAAYAHHPLLQTVGIDRTYYGPIEAKVFAGYAASVGDDFRFLVKAHEYCTIQKFPRHARYGPRGGTDNPHFLDPTYALTEVIQPFVEGLGDKAGPLVFQFMPQSVKGLGGPQGFAERLHAFLTALPQGPLYAVEIRNRALLTDAYAKALREASACHCFNVHPTMPSVIEQARVVEPLGAGALVVRWMLGGDLRYDTALELYEPFNRIVNADPHCREDLAQLVAEAHHARAPSFVVVNNKAEGSAPLSVFALAEQIAGELARIRSAES